MARRAAIGITCAAAALCAWSAAGGSARSGEVWTPSPLEPVFEGPKHTGGADSACAIRLVGTRNGTVSGQAVVFAKEGMKGPEAKMSVLRSKDGKVELPASKVRIRYALPDGRNGLSRLAKGERIFDTLAEKPREGGTTHPVWVTVEVPGDAAPGEYQGSLALAGREVPVHLNLVCHSNLGNAETIVRGKKENGAYVPDLSAARKYLDLALDSGCRPQVVVLYLYEGKIGGGHLGTTEKGKDTGADEERRRGARLTLLDAEGQGASVFEGPCFNSANAAFPRYPAVAFDGTNFLVVWEDCRVVGRVIREMRPVQKVPGSPAGDESPWQRPEGEHVGSGN